MFGQLREFSVFLGLALLCLSCTRLPERSPDAGGQVAVVTLQDFGAVPAGWGNLVSTIGDPFNTQLTRLFFEDEEGTIRVVFYNSQLKTLWRDVQVIRRQ